MTAMPDRTAEVAARMEAAGLPGPVIDDFLRRYAQLVGGCSGKVRWDAVSPPAEGDLVDLEPVVAADAAHAARGAALLEQLVCIRLNGGLGTTMGLSRPKSLIAVRDGRCFLQLVVAQIEHARATYGVQTPLLLMNSYHTHDDSLAVGVRWSQPRGLPLDFLQHRVPRIDAVSGLPCEPTDGPGGDALAWAPPGHGDIYFALWLSGLLDRLIDAGYRWAFVSNIDNLGATVEPALLGYIEASGADFAMEVTDKTAADVKGGTLVRHLGRLSLLERAQVVDARLADFEDVGQLSVFNTNNLWWRLEALRLRLQDGPLGLPTLVNPKRLGGREVVQLETAMGAAISCFERAVGVRVSRRRFAPVKSTGDLLAIRSDAYALDETGALRLAPERPVTLGPPVIRLDPRFYSEVEDLERRCPHPLGLLGCRSLTVHGELHFGRDVVMSGDVVLRNDEARPRHVPDGARIVGGSSRV